MSTKKSTSDQLEEYQTTSFSPGWNHAVAGTLKGKNGLVEYYKIYHFPKQNEEGTTPPIAVAVVKIGNQLDGPVGVVHGGIVALMFDDFLGYTAHSLLPWVVTRDLSIEYKLPQPHEEYVVIRAYHDDEKATSYSNMFPTRDGQKKRVFLRATCSSLGSSTIHTAPFEKGDGILYSRATLTFVQVQRPPSAREAANDNPGKFTSKL